MGLSVAFIYERGDPPRINHIFRQVMTMLSLKGVTVSVVYPEELLLSIEQFKVDADLYVLKSDTEMALSWATAMENMGAKVLNSAYSCQLVKNKFAVTSLLLKAGLRVPSTYFVNDLQSVMANGKKLMQKAHRGYHGVGVELISNDCEPLVSHYVQEYLDDRYRKDLKIFVIGEHIYGVRKSFSKDSYLKSGKFVEVSSEIKEIVRRCGKILNLELFGVDIAEGEDGYYIMDVNYIPGYRGIEGAAEKISDLLYLYAR